MVVGCWLLVVGCLVVLLIALFIHLTKPPNNKTTKQQNHNIKILLSYSLSKKTKADDFYGSLRCVP